MKTHRDDCSNGKPLIQPFHEADWGKLLKLANQAVPFAAKENDEWLENRITFDESKYIRRNYLASFNAKPVGYGCLEQQSDDPKWLRIFVVCHPANLRTEVGEDLTKRLLMDAKELGAEHLWAREYQADEAICNFFIRKGFKETKRFVLPGQKPMVVLILDLDG